MVLWRRRHLRRRFEVRSSERVIVALDFATAQQAIGLVKQLGDPASHYKVGLQLLTAAGPSVARELVTMGKQVFLDLKLFEIPNSVAGAVTAAGHLGVNMITVHASAGSAVLAAAVAAARPFARLKVLALTVITSMSEQDLAEVGVAGTVAQQVLRLAKLSIEAGCHGVVASPLEAALLRKVLPEGSLIVTPGVRLLENSAFDHVRTDTPAVAMRAGATHVVIGRSIICAGNPADAFAAVCAQLQVPMDEMFDPR